ncbi:MAG: Fic family protein [ANME-2 cluster archaeon]|nr:Fic family protein [ANME-2 cluster archaeon]
MREFNYLRIDEELYNKEIVGLMTELHEYRGKQELYMESYPDVLEAMVKVAKIQSTGASNRIEGIYTSEKRLGDLVNEKTEPRNRNEEEIAGYREVLNTIHENYDYIVPRSNVVLQLHRNLYAYNSGFVGGNYKHADNVIEEQNELGEKRVRFTPVPAYLTKETMEAMCGNFIEAIKKESVDPLLLIPVFILDFLCVHPFNDGNGRMSRLLTLLLLYQNSYIVGKYISIEMMIEKTKESYYETLEMSSFGWHENNNDYVPFVKYYLGVVLAAYREFSSRVEILRNQGLSKSERVKHVFETKVGKISKSDISKLCPDISITTIEKALAELVKNNYIRKVGGGRSTAYIRND